MKLLPDPNVCLLLSTIIKQFQKPECFTNALIKREQFLAQEKPDLNSDIQYVCDESFIRIADYNSKYLLAAKQLLGASQCTNAILYPPKHSMSWHTNSDLIGVRTYYVYAERPGIFAYIEDDEIKYDEDDKGWTVRQFEIRPDKPFWHSVWSDSERYAFGFLNVV